MIGGMWCCDACPKRTESASVHLCSDCAPSFALPFYPKAAQDGAES